jgi:hypothetical protein
MSNLFENEDLEDPMLVKLMENMEDNETISFEEFKKEMGWD